jgi:hypothetical protein
MQALEVTLPWNLGLYNDKQEWPYLWSLIFQGAKASKGDVSDISATTLTM